MQRYEEMEITFRLNFNCAMNKHCDRLKKKKVKRKQAYHCLLIAYSIEIRGRRLTLKKQHNVIYFYFHVGMAVSYFM